MKLCSSRHSMARRRLQRQRGVALIESLVAMLIFSFGVLGLMGLEARVLSSSVDADDRNRASLFASEVASWMWTNATITPSAAQLTAWNASVANSSQTGLPNGVLTIVGVPATTNAADITITWKSPARKTTDAPSKLTTRVILP